MVAALLSTLLGAQGIISARVYHIGNSITDTIRYSKLKEMANSSFRNYVFGRHMIPGAPLEWLWEHPQEGFTETEFGYPKKALTQFKWDVLTLQPFDRMLDSDLLSCKRYIDLMEKMSPNARILIYSRWPRRESNGDLDYARLWNRKYTGGWDGTNESRDYFERVYQGVKKSYPGRKVEIVPVGDVFLLLDRAMRSSNATMSVKDLYVDAIHMGDLGSFAVGLTFYSWIFQVSPTTLNLSKNPYGKLDSGAQKMVVDAVEEVWRSKKANE